MKFIKWFFMLVLILGAFYGLNFLLNLTYYNPAFIVPAYERVMQNSFAKKIFQSNHKEELYPLVPISTLNKSLFFGPRAAVIGEVTDTVKVDDGDWHINIKDDKGNTMVVEAIPEYKMAIPKVGLKIKIRGITRYDLEHRWWELHPAINWEEAKPNKTK